MQGTHNPRSLSHISVETAPSCPTSEGTNEGRKHVLGIRRRRDDVNTSSDVPSISQLGDFKVRGPSIAPSVIRSPHHASLTKGAMT